MVCVCLCVHMATEFRAWGEVKTETDVGTGSMTRTPIIALWCQRCRPCVTRVTSQRGCLFVYLKVRVVCVQCQSEATESSGDVRSCTEQKKERDDETVESAAVWECLSACFHMYLWARKDEEFLLSKKSQLNLKDDLKLRAQWKQLAGWCWWRRWPLQTWIYYLTQNNWNNDYSSLCLQ